MSYSGFSLDEVEQKFGLKVEDQSGFFADRTPISPSSWLTESLSKGMERAVSMGTEKARSEFIVAPILLEALDHVHGHGSLFSGVEFNVDQSLGLNGVVDFLLSLSPTQIKLESPIVAVVEAKNENVKLGYGQCVAEMYAAKVFNERRKNSVSTIYGVVTTGSQWFFLQMNDEKVVIDRHEYFIEHVDQIVGILVSMLKSQ